MSKSTYHTQAQQLYMAKVADKHEKAMANTKWSAWWHNSNTWLFLFVFNFQWTKNKNRKENQTKLVSCIYKKEKKKMKHNYFTSMTAFSNHWFSKKWKRKKNVIIGNPFHSRIHLYIYPTVHPVCVVCAITVWPCPPSLPPHPSHRHTQTSETGCTKACV